MSKDKQSIMEEELEKLYKEDEEWEIYEYNKMKFYEEAYEEELENRRNS